MGLAFDQLPQNYATNDAAVTQQQAQLGATDAFHKELQSTLAPADQLHAAAGSLIGADVQTASAQPPGSSEATLDPKAQKVADTQEVAMRAVGLGDLQFSGQSDINGVRESVAQQGRQNAASALAFNNIFSQVGEGSSSSHSGFPGRNDTLQFNNNSPLTMQGRQLAMV